MSIIEFYENQNAVVQEALSTLRTNISFAGNNKKIKKLAIVSYNASEGKTTTSINLSINYARAGFNTLLIDTDMRKSLEYKTYGADVDTGLSTVISDKLYMDQVVRATNIENLFFLPSGPKHLDPTGYFSSNEFKEFLAKAEKEYDFIILDTPALGSVIDAAIVASLADAAIMIVSTGRIKMSGFKRARDQLLKANVNFLGVVLNKVKKSEYRKYFDIYGYYFKRRIKKKKWSKRK
ncbi:MAG: CpsD/CapB family tyrosine-protein kinase [Clostridia bacterium]|nr:CpsD/CapB family tyrosine-protein kinase [Clostridia bacterium]